MRKIICKKIAFVMAIVLTAVNVVMFPGDVQAVDGDAQATNGDAGQKVVYQQYLDKEDVRAYIKPKVAPTYKATKEVEVDEYGYLFGGWFTKGDDGKFRVIKEEADLDKTTNWYAKFVPSYILSVKCQNYFGTTSDTANTEIVMVSGVDSRNYKEVGFVTVGVNLENNGDLKSVGKNPKKLVSQNEEEKPLVWEKLAVYNSEESYQKCPPKNVLGTEGEYFMGYRLTFGKANYAKALAIRPYWVTFDGVTVYGLTKYSHVIDGIEGYINIPVNLKNENDVAAGVVEFDWSVLKAAGYKYLGAECGKRFKTQKVNSAVTDNGKNIIRCLVMADVTNTNQCEDVPSDDIYINLRFQKADDSTQAKPFDGTFYHFPVHQEDFSDMRENVYQETVADTNVNKNIITLYDVWNIQY